MQRRPLSLIASLFCASFALGTVIPAAAESAHARLRGYEEVPVISTAATGELRLKIRGSDNEIDYALSYEDLQGDVRQAHIHVGQPGVAGGISVWLCQTTASPSPVASTPNCPTPGGTVTGTLTAADVIGPNVQLVAPGEMAELIRAIRAGVAYGNVHSSQVPGGEIRGQLR
jgi:hypothetical protein